MSGVPAWLPLRAACFDTFLFDIDGVLLHGTTPVAGALEQVGRLQAANKRCVFVTNNSTRSRKVIAAGLTAAGLAARAEDVISSASAAAAHLAAVMPGCTAFVVGEAGLLEELELRGISCVSLQDYPTRLPEAHFRALFTQPSLDAVVCGLDTTFTSAKLATAAAHLQRGALFIGTNPDAGDRVHDAGLTPGCGALLAALEVAGGVQAHVVGKPASQLIEQLVERYKLDRSRTVMIGDRLDTDMAFAHAGGIASCLVLTGVASAAQAAALPEGHPQRPKFLMPAVADLVWE